MIRKTKMAVALLLAIGIGIIFSLMTWEYRRDSAAFEKGYAGAINARDIADALATAFALLQGAEINAQNYALTGQTVYLEAYRKNAEDWNDYFNVLEGQVRGDAGERAVASQLSLKTTQVFEELALLVSIREKGSRETVLAEIEKGSAIVYLGQAKEMAATLKRFTDDDLARDLGLFRSVAHLSQRRLLWGAIAVFALMLVLAFALKLASPRRT